jgi:hypothetical protein
VIHDFSTHPEERKRSGHTDCYGLKYRSNLGIVTAKVYRTTWTRISGVERVSKIHEWVTNGLAAAPINRFQSSRLPRKPRLHAACQLRRAASPSVYRSSCPVSDIAGGIQRYARPRGSDSARTSSKAASVSLSASPECRSAF